MFGPLNFPEASTSTSRGPLFYEDQERVAPCILCEKEFLFPGEKEQCLRHILQDHHLVIGDAESITDLPRYLEFWKHKMSIDQVKQYCSTMLVDVKKDGVVYSDQEFFLLSDIDKDDKMIREKLRNETIEMVLEQQRFEREDRCFSRGCFMCRQIIEPTRQQYVTHLNESHNVLLGHPDNLVFLDKLFQALDQKMDDLQCIFCEKVFKDRVILKEHMRKKGHKRINPDNQFYDKFYIVNYLEPGTSWKDKGKRERKPSIEEEDTADWSDWEEKLPSFIICLFCPTSESSWDNILLHMKTLHNFDYDASTKGFDFYKQVKFVNYIRRQIYWNKCIICNEMSSCNKDIIKHMTSEGHLIPPDINLWDKPEFFFPTYENDSFLCHLDDTYDQDDGQLSEILSETVNLDETP
ncbi:zinc finger protein 277 [Cimex lectularius]|uniref:C2H2-type domain-containing protein n=1 Tax=Cimex lectularius TaxID=79782 RepID=A0A8I6RQW4_CIMLE|nr:zinc finger protein 277 [Cimex lectularius]